MHANDTKLCDHDWTDSLEEPGLQVCGWCPATREAPIADAVEDSAHVVMVVVEARRAA